MLNEFEKIFDMAWDCKAIILRHINDIFYWHHIYELDIVKEDELLGLDNEIRILDSNTLAFLSNKEASNAILWGARGCGKSSVVKAVCGKYLESYPLYIVEIDSKDIALLPIVIDALRRYDELKFIVFCDDLAFMPNDYSYRSIKSTLEGTFEKPASNVLIYATSNIRHIVQEDVAMNSLHSQDSVNEVLSLSDRFPLSIGFYALGSNEYLSIVKSLILRHCDNDMDRADVLFSSIRQEALNFSTKMGNKNARTAHSFWRVYRVSNGNML